MATFSKGLGFWGKTLLFQFSFSNLQLRPTKVTLINISHDPVKVKQSVKNAFKLISRKLV